MKILFIGDSITKGYPGASFVDLLHKEFPNWTYKNLGVNGDTLPMISKRLLAHLKNNPDYDVIVLQGGYNDLLLPSFKERGGLFGFAYNHQLKKGQVPLSTHDLYPMLKTTVREIKQMYRGKLILMTLGCLNEKTDTKLNEHRKDWNKTIRQITEEETIFLADAGKLVDAFLDGKDPINYCLESFWAVTYRDSIISSFKKGIDLLSNRRKLFVTIDGVHLNNLGAVFFSDSIQIALKGAAQVNNAGN